MPIKFYTDTHIDKALTVQLRLRGVDIIRCEEVGMASAADLEHLAYAAREGRTIVTKDRGFGGWHRQWLDAGNNHAGILVITVESIGIMVNELYFLHEAVVEGAATLEGDLYNQIRYVPEK